MNVIPIPLSRLNYLIRAGPHRSECTSSNGIMVLELKTVNFIKLFLPIAKHHKNTLSLLENFSLHYFRAFCNTLSLG